MTENAQLVVTLSCPDRPGIVHAVTGVIGESGGNVIQSQQFGDPDTGTFFMRVEVDSSKGRAPIDEGLARVAEEFSATYRVDDLGRKLRTIIMVSREGHCLTDLLYRQQTQGLPIDVIAVVGNHPDLAPVAQFYGVPFLNIPVTKDTKAQAERQLLDLIASEKVELVVLARYMQILSDQVCRAMQGRVINIHHSFLPSFKGRALRAGPRSRRQANRRDRPLRDRRPGRGADHRAGRHPRLPRRLHAGHGGARPGRGAPRPRPGRPLPRGAPRPHERQPHGRLLSLTSGARGVKHWPGALLRCCVHRRGRGWLSRWAPLYLLYLRECQSQRRESVV